MEEFEALKKQAHPNALHVLKAAFYWDTTEEMSPFGSDDGFNAFHNFKEWIGKEENDDPMLFVEELLAEWEYPTYDYHSLNIDVINEYIVAQNEKGIAVAGMQESELVDILKEANAKTGEQVSDAQYEQILALTGGAMGKTLLSSIDNVILATGFGQFALEGEIDEGMRILTRTAVTRQLLPLFIERWGEHAVKRKEVLQIMLEDLEEMGK